MTKNHLSKAGLGSGVALISLLFLACAGGESANESGAEAQAARGEPFAGDIVNNSRFPVRVWGDHIPGADSGGYACISPGVSSHNLSGNIDVDYAYSASRSQWCKIGAGEVRINADGSWQCPNQWETPHFLRTTQLGC